MSTSSSTRRTSSADDEHDDIETSFKLAIAREYSQRTPTPGNKRVACSVSGTTPIAIQGTGRADGLEVSTERHGTEVIETPLILRSIGYRGLPVAGLPYDEDSGTVPNDSGRVVPGTYVTGWMQARPAWGDRNQPAVRRADRGPALDGFRRRPADP